MRHRLVKEGVTVMLSGKCYRKLVLVAAKGDIYEHSQTEQKLFKLSKESVVDLDKRSIQLEGFKPGQVEYIPILD